jgi:hypothetical protein
MVLTEIVGSSEEKLNPIAPQIASVGTGWLLRMF